MTAHRPSKGTVVWWWAAALVPALLGLALRLHYLLTAEPFVDEPTTLLVAQAIARTGRPILPSGLFYGNDLPFSYLSGGLVALFGPHLIVLRLFSLLSGVATIFLVVVAGRRFFSTWAGFWAGLLLALSPEAILWGGRARAYALLGLLVFLSVWSFYGGLAADRRWVRRLGWLLLVIAAFVHPEAALLLLPFALGATWLHGWRWWLREGRLIELALAGVGVLARYAWQQMLAWGVIGGFATAVGSRPVLEAPADLLTRLQGVAPFFLAPQRLPWTLLAVLALAAALWGTRRAADSPSRAALFFSLCLWLPPLEMLLLFGSTYQSTRYLTMLLPPFALVAAFGLDWLVRRLRRRTAAAFFLTALLLAFTLPGAVEAARSREKGFRSAFEYVARHQQPGDRVASVAPAYSYLVLGRNDLFTLGRDYEEFVYRADDGRWVDRWLGSPLVRTAEELNAALDAEGRLWFVTDEGRLRTRFDAAFAQLVWDRMELAARTDGVLVFVTADAPEAAVSRPVGAVFGGQIALVGYDLGRSDQRPADAAWGQVVVQPGQVLPLTLYWQAVAPIEKQYTVFVHLLDPVGERVAQDDGPPLKGLQPMSHWPVGERLPDRRRLELPAALSPGRYRLLVGFYEPQSGDRLPLEDAPGTELTLDYVRIPASDETLPVPDVALDIELTGDGDSIRLLGYDLGAGPVAPGSVLPLTLYWQAVGRPTADYTVFIHLLDAGGQIQAQDDGPPLGGAYPSSHWDPGEIVTDAHRLGLPADLPPGRYRLAVGLYRLETGQRLTTPQGDRVLLEEVQVR